MEGRGGVRVDLSTRATSGNCADSLAVSARDGGGLEVER